MAVTGDVAARRAAIQLEEEQRVRQLAGAVAFGLAVALVGVEVVPVDLAFQMGDARGHDHPRPRRLRQFGQEQRRASVNTPR